MRRTVARGRMFPQSFSTDRRYGRLSLKALALFPLMWANADDQGRLCGDPEEIKYAVCPNIDHITKRDVPDLLKEIQNNELIFCYNTPKSAAIQILDWWDANHKMQWAWPSDYPPSEGWEDHLRYKKSAQEVATLNWPVSGERSGESPDSVQVSEDTPSGERSGESLDSSQVSEDNSSGERSGEKTAPSPLTTPSSKTIKRTIKRTIKIKSPEDSGEEPSLPSLDIKGTEGKVYGMLKENYHMRWGRVSSKNPNVVIRRPLKAGDDAQLHGLAKEISAAGGCEEPMIKKAFDEAAGAQKQYISYVRGMLLDWLGVDRKHYGT